MVNTILLLTLATKEHEYAIEVLDTLQLLLTIVLLWLVLSSPLSPLRKKRQDDPKGKK